MDSLGMALSSQNLCDCSLCLSPLTSGCWTPFLFPVRTEDCDLWVSPLNKEPLLYPIHSQCGITLCSPSSGPPKWEWVYAYLDCPPPPCSPVHQPRHISHQQSAFSCSTWYPGFPHQGKTGFFFFSTWIPVVSSPTACNNFGFTDILATHTKKKTLCMESL